MQRNVIDTNAPTLHVTEQILLLTFILTEVVHSQRVTARFNGIWNFGDVIVGHNREHWAKNFLMHNLHVFSDILEYVQRHAPITV